MKLPLCTRPWTDLHIYHNGRITPCCVITLSQKDLINTTSIDEYHSSEWLASLKYSLENEVQDSRCNNCWHKNSISTTDSHLAQKTSYERFSHLHLRVSNLCNFSCRICNDTCSSTWAQENKKYESSKVEIYDNILDNPEQYIPYLKQAKKITLAGGEPLYSKTTFQLFEILKKLNLYPKIYMNTNLSTISYLGKSWKDIFTPFDVNLHASIDGYGSQMEYSRTGAQWDKTIKNFYYLYSNISDIFSTVSIFSVYSMPEIYRFALSNKKQITPNFVTGEQFSIVNLPKEEKHKIIREYSKYKDFTVIRNRLIKEIIIPMMHEPPQEVVIAANKQFKLTTLKLDKRRNTNFVEVYPQFKEWFENIEV